MNFERSRGKPRFSQSRANASPITAHPVWRMARLTLVLCCTMLVTACGSTRPRPVSNGPVTRVYLAWGETPLLMACFDAGRGWWNSTAGCIPEPAKVPDEMNGLGLFSSATVKGDAEAKCSAPEKSETIVTPESLLPFFEKMTPKRRATEVHQTLHFDLNGDGRTEQLTFATSETFEKEDDHFTFVGLYRTGEVTVPIAEAEGYFWRFVPGSCIDANGNGRPEFLLRDGGESELVFHLVEWEERGLRFVGMVGLGD